MLDKPANCLKRDPVRTDSTFDKTEYEKIEVERNLRTCAKGTFKIFPSFNMEENNKILRECYKDHFIKKFKPEGYLVKVT